MGKKISKKDAKIGISFTMRLISTINYCMLSLPTDYNDCIVEDMVNMRQYTINLMEKYKKIMKEK